MTEHHLESEIDIKSTNELSDNINQRYEKLIDLNFAVR